MTRYKTVIHEVTGHQLITVQFTPGGTAYTYLWDGKTKLRPGDRVQVPPTWVNPNPQWATVSSEPSTYEGFPDYVLEAQRNGEEQS